MNASHRARALGAAIVAMLLLAGCASAPAPTPSPFGGTWTVLSIDGEEIAEQSRAPIFQFLAGGVADIVTRCHERHATMTEGAAGRLTIGDTSEVDEAQACDATDARIDQRLVAALAGVQEYTGGRPADRLTLTGATDTIVLAQPAANPTFG
ncbi:MAG: META domain-containing protein [Chloroflexota bacterium]